jgi:hypothetical protein
MAPPHVPFGQIIHHGFVAFGELSINGTGSIELHPGAAAGVWALLAANAADLEVLKAGKPSNDGAVVAFSNLAAPAVDAESSQGEAISARAHGNGTAAIHATHDGDANSTALLGENAVGRGISGMSQTGQGVYGHSKKQAGVVGESSDFDGVYGISHNQSAAGVSGHNPGGLAGYFDGNVIVTGDICCPGADCAEQFDISSSSTVHAGMVMSIRDDGSLGISGTPYDRRVAGVVSGAGSFRPGIVLDKTALCETGERKPIALVGKVYCWADAQYSPIVTGDLLTTSPTPGHAMKASDRERAFGAVLGKALKPLTDGCALIPMLIALQ